MEIFDDEQALVTAAIRRDHAAFGQLFDVHYAQILGYCVRRTGTIEVAEDITAEVFMKAWRSIDKYSVRGIPFRAWLYKIATNELRMHYRTGKHHALSLDELSEEQGYLPMSSSDIQQEAMEAQELLDQQLRFHDALEKIQQLPIKYQEVLVLRYVEHKKLNEIAVITDRKVGTVKSLLSRGITKLRAAMQPFEGDRILPSEDLHYQQRSERNV